ncbi:synaptonemal complex protein 3 isoform X2 [Anabas testudineus]|uniref:synaptonemal complex protein 3 isoform X2 n=1 Tax=Anabas testudineus TaxID=64144 RepID=UPI000E45E838|nr:synaptonemal complex protein 3 isoform X2 [Anabas testudineus]
MQEEQVGRMATGRKQLRKKHLEEKSDKKVFEFTQEDKKKELSGSEDDVRGDETPIVDKLAKKRPAEDFEVEEANCAVGNEVQSMLERFGADISKVMQAKKKRLESLTKNYMKGSQHKLEQLWNNYHSQRQKITQQYSQQVSTALQQWETEAQRAEEQEEKLNNMEEMEKSHEAFMQGAQQELRKEMATLQKKILMDTQQQEMATVRKSLQSMLF